MFVKLRELHELHVIVVSWLFVTSVCFDRGPLRVKDRDISVYIFLYYYNSLRVSRISRARSVKMRNIGHAGLVPQNCDMGNKWIHFDVWSNTVIQATLEFFTNFPWCAVKSRTFPHLLGNRADFVRILLRLNSLPLLFAPTLAATRADCFVDGKKCIKLYIRYSFF